MLLQLGAYQFSINSAAYQTLQKTYSWQWPEQQRFNKPPAYQYLGKGESVIALQGVIYPHYKGGWTQIENMVAEADKGRPLKMIDGRGNILGDFIIASISETETIFNKDGSPNKIEFNLSIKKYG